MSPWSPLRKLNSIWQMCRCGRDKPASAVRLCSDRRARRCHCRPGTSRRREGSRPLCCLCEFVSGVKWKFFQEFLWSQSYFHSTLSWALLTFCSTGWLKSPHANLASASEKAASFITSPIVCFVSTIFFRICLRWVQSSLFGVKKNLDLSKLRICWNLSWRFLNHKLC